VTVNATCLEELPVEPYLFDEEEYGRWAEKEAT